VAFCLVAVATMGAGCAPPWTVVRSSGPPSALASAGPITVAFDYSRLQIAGMNEQQFVESKVAKEADYPTKWQNLKNSFEESVITGLAGQWSKGVARGAPGAGVGLVVIPTSLSMGHYMVVAATPTTVSTTLDWVVGGQAVEEIAITDAQQATVFTPSVFQHITPIGSAVGQKAGRYLASRNK